MRSILASLGAALVAYIVVAVLFDPFAAVVPAGFAFVVAAFLLFRRISQRIQEAMAPLEGLLRGQKVDEADALLAKVGADLGPWMPYLAGQIAAQRGMLEYARGRFDAAVPKLTEGRSQSWHAMACLGCVHWRKGNKDACFAELEAATKQAPKEPLAWILRAVLLHKGGRDEDALKALAGGLTQLPGHAQLTDLQGQLANKKKVDPVQFGQGWFQFFPEELQQQRAPRAFGGYQPFGPGFRGPAASKRSRRG
jgi:tetratricopeptide (TPR) repeat protein